MPSSRIEHVIGSYAGMTRDFRALLKKVTDPTTYYNVTDQIDDKEVSVLKVSLYNNDADGETRAFPVTSRDFASDTAFHLNATRFLLVPLRLEIHGKPKFMIEPGGSARRWVRRRLGVKSAGDYIDAILSGPLGRRLIEPAEKRRASAEDEQDKATKRVSSLRKKNANLEAQREDLVRSRGTLLKSLEAEKRERISAEEHASISSGQAARDKDARGEAARMAAYWEEKFKIMERDKRHLHSQLVANGITPTRYQPPVI